MMVRKKYLYGRKKMLKSKQMFDIVQQALNLLVKHPSEIEMIELGSQGIDVPGISYKIAKDYFKSLGFKHTSIDLDGNFGSLVVDLTTQLTDFYNKYDIVTNFGTSEHIENQFACFENIHYFCKDNGVMVHSVPLPDNWVKHCKYHYPPAFFDQLCLACGYEVCENKNFNMPGGLQPRGLVNVILIKRGLDNFINKYEFAKLPIIIGKYTTNHNNRF